VCRPAGSTIWCRRWGCPGSVSRRVPGSAKVAAALRQAFLQPDRAQASQTLRHIADQLRPIWPKLAAFLDDSETEVLSYLDFPEQHRSKLHSTNPLERLNKEVKRRADVVGIFPSEAAIIRLIGAVLLEQNDECQLQHRYMQVEAMAELAAAAGPADPGRSHAPPSLAHLKRSTAASKAWMPNARPQCRCQAPQPRSGAPQAQGLIVARRPQHNPPCRRSLPAAAPTAANLSTDAATPVAPQLQSRISTSLTDVTPRYDSSAAMDPYTSHLGPSPDGHKGIAAGDTAVTESAWNLETRLKIARDRCGRLLPPRRGCREYWVSHPFSFPCEVRDRRTRPRRGWPRKTQRLFPLISRRALQSPLSFVAVTLGQRAANTG
jgi:hypothetical protein